MPNRRRAVDPSSPLGELSARLRALHDHALATAGGSEAARKLQPDRIAATSTWRTSRTAIYAALNGTRIPSVDTLCALVSALDPRDERIAIPEWLKLRSQAEQGLEGERVSYTAAVADPSTPQPDAPPIEYLIFAQELNAARLRAGITRAQLAVKAGYSPRSIFSTLEGRRLPRWDLIENLLHVLAASEEESAEHRKRWEAALLASQR
ncbi:helix-turn-helix domain-containing protein [Streptomyces sp. CA-210063]|uniref:helix-turn-helix domain-containing protein n=1 Tax=Streptomyces sp. CA-210063 TaxID=2801029 RepID=UPI003FA7B3EC